MKDPQDILRTRRQQLLPGSFLALLPDASSCCSLLSHNPLRTFGGSTIQNPVVCCWLGRPVHAHAPWCARLPRFPDIALRGENRPFVRRRTTRLHAPAQLGVWEGVGGMSLFVLWCSVPLLRDARHDLCARSSSPPFSGPVVTQYRSPGGVGCGGVRLTVQTCQIKC